MSNFKEKNDEREILYRSAYQKALSIGKYFCHDIDLAEEIAQLTIIKLYLWKDKIEKPDKWLYQVARNNALQILKEKHRSQNFQAEVKKMLKNRKLPDIVNHPELEYEIKNIPDSFFDKTQKAIAFDYFCQNYNKNELSIKYSLTECKMAEKLYHLRQELILYLKFICKFQYIEPVPGTRLHRNICNFISKLFYSIMHNEFDSISHFLENSDEFNIFFSIPNFMKLKKYEIKPVKGNIARLIIVYYAENLFPYSIYMSTQIKDYKKITKVFDPEIPKNIFFISSDDINDVDKKISERTSKGGFVCSKEEMTEIIKKYKIKKL